MRIMQEVLYHNCINKKNIINMPTLSTVKSLKTCKTCKQEKPINLYGIDAGEKDGLSRYCKSCVKEKRIKSKQGTIEAANAIRLQILSLALAKKTLDKSIVAGFNHSDKIKLEDIFKPLPNHAKERIYEYISSEISRLIVSAEDKYLKL
jgi:hypothetical protein